MEIDLLNLLAVLLTAWVAGHVADRFAYPAVLGELLAGILLGPPLIGILHGGPALEVLAYIGILVMMLYIGMEIEPRELGRSSLAGFLAAIGGFVTPFVLAYFVVLWFGGTHVGALFVGIAAGVTSLATKSRILADLQILDTRVAHVLMVGAVVSDTLALIAFAAIMGVAETGSPTPGELGWVAAKALLFFAVTAAIGARVFPWAGRRLSAAGLTGRTFNFTLVVLLAVSFGELAEVAGLHAILGSFIAGLFLRDSVLGRSLSRDLVRAVREVSIGFLAPIFFVTAGFSVSFSVFRGADLGLLLAILGVAIAGKVLGTVLFYLPTGRGWREGLTIGAGMNGRGAVEIIVAGIGLERGLISQEIFSILVFMAIFTTATVPALLKWTTDWLRRRGELVRMGGQREGAVVVGAGPLARRLARVLAKAGRVTVVDSNRWRCRRAEEEGLRVVCGDALQERLLGEAGAGGALRLVAMTANPEVNALVARAAREIFDIPRVHVIQADREEAERDATLDHLGATRLFGGPVPLERWDHHAGLAELDEEWIDVEEPVAAEAFLRALSGRERDALPLALERADGPIPFHAGLELAPGDRVLVLRPRTDGRIERDRFDEAVLRAPVLDLEERLDADAFFARAAQAVAAQLSLPPEPVAEALRRRERDGSTVLAPGLAVPHVRIEAPKRFALLLARSRPGIRFPAQETPVRTVFLMADGTEDRTVHLRALSAVAQIVQNPGFEERWLSARDAEELRRLVLTADRSRQPS